MSRSFSWIRLLVVGVAVVALVAALNPSALRSIAQESDDAVATDDAAADEQDEGKDPLAIPKGGPKQLLEFLGEVGQLSVEGDTPEEQEAFRLRAISTMVDVAEMVLASKPNNRQAANANKYVANDRQALTAHQYRLEALQALVMLGDEEAQERLDAAIEEARSDKREPIAATGWGAHLSRLFGTWDELDDAGKQDVKNEILNEVRAGKPTRLDVSIVSSAAGALADVDDVFAADLLKEALPILKKSRDKKVTDALADTNMEGVLRRLQLPGNQIEISGTLLNGKRVNWDSYRGKVVLVDFWATWCGPCREEVPNVLAMYKAYHDKGFEVLGVSLDMTEEDAHKYVDENHIPWQSIFPKNKKDRYWNSPLVRHYGINGIPTAILVDKEGKVVHMNARGGYLRQQLQELLGDPLIDEEESEQSGGE